MINWDDIDTVLFDMDGTLLDLHYDIHVWSEVVPKRWAQVNKIPLARAREYVHGKIMNVYGELEFYDIFYWNKLLSLDIEALHREQKHLIDWRPGARELLVYLKAAGKRVVLATNCHRKVLEIKFEMTDLAAHLDLVVSSHDFGIVKEDRRFWGELGLQETFDPGSTAFFDDNLAVLNSARDFGIEHVYGIAAPSSQGKVHQYEHYPVVEDLRQLIL